MRGLVVGVVLWLAGTATAAPVDFTAETRALHAVAACGAPAPPAHDAATIAAHCKALAKSVEQWRGKWLAYASPWFRKVIDKYPATVVYPFGGGDVITMLAVYPDATEYTTLSLEGMGDPRLPATFDKAKLASALGNVRAFLNANLGAAWNTTVQLSNVSSEGSGIPGILTSVLVALEVHGYEPLEARYFELLPDGTPRYLTRDQIEVWDAAKPAPRRKATQVVQRGLFNNVELVFRKQGDPNAPKKTFRHIAADLSDRGLEAHAGALRYLDKRTDVAAMTKAAAYLLWRPDFEKVRAVLLARMKLMVSDDTGIPPRHARSAGFTQQVYGTYTGVFFKGARGAIERELVELWKRPVEAALPFRFGYYDNRRTSHLMITRR